MQAEEKNQAMMKSALKCLCILVKMTRNNFGNNQQARKTGKLNKSRKIASDPAIPMKGKNNDKLDSYHPVTLTSYINKIAECMI